MKASQSKECFNDKCPESSNICSSILFLSLELCSDNNNQKSSKVPQILHSIEWKQNNFKISTMFLSLVLPMIFATKL